MVGVGSDIGTGYVCGSTQETLGIVQVKYKTSPSPYGLGDFACHLSIYRSISNNELSRYINFILTNCQQTDSWFLSSETVDKNLFLSAVTRYPPAPNRNDHPSRSRVFLFLYTADVLHECFLERGAASIISAASLSTLPIDL